VPDGLLEAQARLLIDQLKSVTVDILTLAHGSNEKKKRKHIKNMLNARDLTELGKQAGFKWPVRFSQNVVNLCTPPKSNKYESFKGRAWDVLNMARWAIKGSRDDYMNAFKVKIGKRVVTLWAMLDTTSGPAIHIITPEEY